MRSFSVEEITHIVGGMLTKAQDATITQIAPPLLSDENTLALALSEEEIANLAKSKAKEIKKFEKKTGIKVKSLEEYEISKEAVKQAQIELKKEEYNKIKENKKATK